MKLLGKNIWQNKNRQNKKTTNNRIRLVERIRREWDEHVKRIDAERSQGTIYLPEEDLQGLRNEDGAT